MAIRFKRFLFLILFFSSPLSADVSLRASLDYVYNNLKSVKQAKEKGKQLRQEFESYEPKSSADQTPTIPHVLFVFDLDDTISQTYSGAQRWEKVHLKAGALSTFQKIWKHGHRLAVATYNVREVEDFLMRELDLNPRRHEDVKTFREMITLEQPSLSRNFVFVQESEPRVSLLPIQPRKIYEYRRGLVSAAIGEPFKTSKGKMIQNILSRFKARGESFDLIAFFDDKVRFHNQVLSESFLDENSQTIALACFEVGQRGAPKYPQFIADPTLAHKSDLPMHPELYTRHFQWIHDVLNSPSYLSDFINGVHRHTAIFLDADDINALTRQF